MNKTILLLLGGTGVGTSSIAIRVAADPAVQVRSVIGTDALREVVREFVPAGVVPELRHSSYDGYLASGDSANLISAYRRQAQVVGMGVAAIIRRAVHENISLIIEGVHLLPEPIQKNLSLHERLHVAEILIDIESPAVHRERLTKRAEFAPERDVSRQLANFERIRQIRGYLREIAEMHRIPVVLNDSTEIAGAVAACVQLYRGNG
jgi:2-phosphoglycerate kinase